MLTVDELQGKFESGYCTETEIEMFWDWYKSERIRIWDNFFNSLKTGIDTERYKRERDEFEIKETQFLETYAEYLKLFFNKNGKS